MKPIIQTRLQTIAEEQQIKIVHAVESGSRAWGFPSTDSDYDVRFIYARPPQWYLSVDLERKRDVIEYPLDQELDITGWDVRKALQLLYKSNPPLLEWFSSPMVYGTDTITMHPLQALAPRFFSPLTCLHHYRGIAQQQYGDYVKGETRQLKKFFYALRCALACQWIEQGLGIVPMPFMELVTAVVPSATLRQQISELVETKRISRELDATPAIVALEVYLEQTLREIATIQPDRVTVDGTIDELNGYFRWSLQTLWESRS